MSKEFDAYYYGFEPTGNEDIDRLLKAVASAGRSYHNTEDWNDSAEWLNGGISPAQAIQDAANESAKNLSK